MNSSFYTHIIISTDNSPWHSPEVYAHRKPVQCGWLHHKMYQCVYTNNRDCIIYMDSEHVGEGEGGPCNFIEVASPFYALYLRGCNSTKFRWHTRWMSVCTTVYTYSCVVDNYSWLPYVFPHPFIYPHGAGAVCYTCIVSLLICHW